ncbi:hypothetical protein PUN28_020591 [Cardiocondyla obscurior]|uniref:Uncharacterized protein n=1 Tax=Cardiocondyla obscurior TaxID=286306 RepID=A0AAW2E6K9_9HYME
MVLNLIAEMTNQAEETLEEDEEENENDELGIKSRFPESFRTPRAEDFKEKKLHKIAMEARTAGKEVTTQKVALYLKEIFPPPPNQKQSREGATPPIAQTRIPYTTAPGPDGVSARLYRSIPTNVLRLYLHVVTHQQTYTVKNDVYTKEKGGQRTRGL